MSVSALGGKKGIASPGAAISGGCELPSLGDGSCNWASERAESTLYQSYHSKPSFSLLFKTKLLDYFQEFHTCTKCIFITFTPNFSS